MKKYIILSGIALFSVVSVTNAQDYNFTKNLSVGISGDEVSALQSWLISNGYDIPAISSGAASKGYFGEQTRQAVTRFQESEGLPNTGYFGPLSRNKIHNRGGKKSTDPRSPVINGIDAPTALSVGEMGTWNVRAVDPRGGTLRYSVDWGDVSYPASFRCPDGYTCTPTSDVATAPAIQQTSTFTHAYKNEGTYRVRFIVLNGLDLFAESTVSVKVMSSNLGNLKITSPNGGEVWTKGTTQTIRWNSPAYFRATNADLKLLPYYEPCNGQLCPMGAQSSGPQVSMMYPYVAPYNIATNVNISQNSYNWMVGNLPAACPNGYSCTPVSLPEGQYTIQICETGTDNCDTSDKPFTIRDSNSRVPQVTSPNGGEVWQANTAQYLRWTIPTGISSMTRLDLYLDPVNVRVNCVAAPCPVIAAKEPYLLDKNIPITMDYNWLVATDIYNARIPDGLYTFRVCLAGSTTECDSGDQVFRIGSPIL